MSRTIYPALTLRFRNDGGWLQIVHKKYMLRGWLCYTDAQFCIGFDKGHSKTKYELWIFRKYSFVEDLLNGFPPNISVDESQILSKKEITAEELHDWENKH